MFHSRLKLPKICINATLSSTLSRKKLTPGLNYLYQQETYVNKQIFVALFAVVFVTQMGWGIVSPLLPLYADSMGASGLWLGIMFSSYAAVRVIFMPIAGRLSDLRDRKTFMTVGLVAYTGISLLYIWAPSIGALVLVRSLHGLASCMVIPIAQAYTGDLTPRGKEGTYINLFGMAMFLGMGCGPALGGILTKLFNMNAAFFGMTTFSCIALYLVLRFVPPAPSLSKTQIKKTVAPFRAILRDNRVQAASIFRFSRAFWRQGLVFFLPLSAVSTLHMTPAGIGLVLSVYLLAGAAAQGLAGPLVDRTNKLASVAIGAITGPILFLLIPHVRSGGLLLVAVLLPIAVLGAFARAAMLAINVKTGRDHEGIGTVMGLFRSAGSLGMMTGPTAFGFTKDVLGLNAVFMVGSAVGVVGGLAVTYILAKFRGQVYV